MPYSGDFAELVREDRVSRALYTDPAVFEAELERIFGTAWIFLGHESQVRQKGDYFTTRIGLDSIIVARHTDGTIHAFQNRCTHRGAEVCHAASGNTRSFVCPYHAWTFRTDGSLAALPLPDGYGPEFESRKGEFDLEKVARVDDYRGFIFGSKRADGPSLDDFLGPQVRAAFDNLVDRSPDGALEIAGGKTVQLFRANWKLQIENSIDLVHPSILHANAVAAANSLRDEPGANGASAVEIEATRANGLTLQEWEQMRIAALPNGHCWMGGFLSDAVEGDGSDDVDEAEEMIDTASEESPWFARYRAALVARHGAAKTEEILSFSRHNTIVYPNLFVNPGLQQVRILHPTAVDRTEQHGYIFRLAGAPPEMFETAVRVLTSVNSPASIVTTDDHEVFERIQEGLSTGNLEWVDWSRGVGRDRPFEDGLTAEGTSELLMRNQHRAWVSYMTGGA